MNNIAIIPARSGSKGLKDKNIKLLDEKPLMAYTIETALKSKMFKKVCVSSDSKQYADIAKEYGAEVPYLRSAALSTDTASPWDVVRDLVLYYESIGETFDTVTLLQPTSPLRTKEDIICGYDKMEYENADAVIGVCAADHSPLWQNILPENNSMTDFVKDEVVSVPRQKLQKYYRINGALYIVKVDFLLKDQNIYKGKSFAYIMDKTHSIDIDDELDFEIAQTLIKKLR